MTVRSLKQRAEIRAYLEADRNYAAYALGDLDDGFFDKCAWYVSEDDGAGSGAERGARRGAIRAMVLVRSYRFLGEVWYSSR
jgi:hypothetical protein